MIDLILEYLLSADAQELAMLAGYVIIGLLILIQWFLSVRPLFIWGLVMPLGFGVLWYIALNPPAFLPGDVGAILLTGADVYIGIAKLGVALSLALLLICRLAMLAKRRRRARLRARRVEEKRQRQLREAVMLANCEPHSPALAAACAAATPGFSEPPGGNTPFDLTK